MRVTFREIGATKGQKFEIKVNGNAVGRISRLPDFSGHFFYLRVGTLFINTCKESKTVEQCKNEARQALQNWWKE